MTVVPPCARIAVKRERSPTRRWVQLVFGGRNSAVIPVPDRASRPPSAVLLVAHSTFNLFRPPRSSIQRAEHVVMPAADDPAAAHLDGITGRDRNGDRVVMHVRPT